MLTMTSRDDGVKAAFRVRVRTTGLNLLSRKCAWCCGVVLPQNGADNADDGDADCVYIPDGVQVDICVHVDMTSGVGADVRAFSKTLPSFDRGSSFMVMEFSCESRESAKSSRGAMVLHAMEYLTCEIENIDDSDTDEDDKTHREEKTDRHLIFARWLMEVFPECFTDSSRVIDVAAGRGDLSRELCVNRPGLHCTLVEPVLREGQDSDKSEVFHREPCDSQLAWIDEAFYASTFEEKWSEILTRSDILIGLHPDQATESLVDCALEHKKPFAVVPCCVYPTLFPHRRLGTGQGVVKYRGLLQFLKEKDNRIQTVRLPFKGRNRVLFLRDY